MFKLRKLGVAAAALLTMPFTAMAADLRPSVLKGAPIPAISYFSWTGLYVGATAGYGSGTSEWEGYGLDVKPKGMSYGATLGYNWQAGSFVYGLEGDYNLSNMKGNATCVVTLTCETENTWYATFRGRVGYAFNRFLPYVTGGGAYGNINASINSVPALSASESRFGYAFGAGLEYALLGNWTVKGEYLYVNLGSFDTGFLAPATSPVGFNTNIVRGGVNYKF